MASKTVAIVTAFYPPHMGGVENYVANLSHQLKRDGWNIVVITSALRGKCGVEDDDGILVYRLPSILLLNERLPILKRNREFKSMSGKLMEMEFDYIMVNTRFYPISLFGLKLAKAKDVPAMVLEHGSAYLTLNNPILDMVLRAYEHAITFLVKRYRPAFYAVSAKSGEWLLTFGIESEGVLSNAVDSVTLRRESPMRDFRNELNIPPDCILVVFSGRILLEKGIITLARAVEAINDELVGGTVHIAFAGEGPAMDALDKHASDKVHILGRLNKDDLSALLKQSDIFCLPTSYPEGFPTAALEAGACGLGIIISNTGGAKELIPSEDFGIILDDASVDSVREALLRFIEDRDYLDLASCNIRNRVGSLFTWDKVANQFGTIVSNV